MKIKVKTINNGEFVAELESDRTLETIYSELSDFTAGAFILLGDRIIQKSSIEEIAKEGK